MPSGFRPSNIEVSCVTTIHVVHMPEKCVREFIENALRRDYDRARDLRTAASGKELDITDTSHPVTWAWLVARGFDPPKYGRVVISWSLISDKFAQVNTTVCLWALVGVLVSGLVCAVSIVATLAFGYCRALWRNIRE